MNPMVIGYSWDEYLEMSALYPANQLMIKSTIKKLHPNNNLL